MMRKERKKKKKGKKIGRKNIFYGCFQQLCEINANEMQNESRNNSMSYTGNFHFNVCL